MNQGENWLFKSKLEPRVDATLEEGRLLEILASPHQYSPFVWPTGVLYHPKTERNQPLETKCQQLTDDHLAQMAARLLGTGMAREWQREGKQKRKCRRKTSSLELS